MIKTYESFIKTLSQKIKNDDEFYYDLLVTVIKNPNRYTGIFRLSNAKTKLMQNVTQSREIKFGDFMEEIVTEYIADMGYENLNKNIGTDEEGNALSADQVFKKDNIIYLIEQKIRDDHDSTKKRGQFENFLKKYTLLHKNYPNYSINATMWFIDDSLTKNKNYYICQTTKNSVENVKTYILYGKDLFEKIFNRIDVWDEICSYLSRNKQERSNEILNIPDFDTSNKVLEALKKLHKNQPALYRKLISNSPTYEQLRKELFPTGHNLKLISGEL